MMKLRPTLLALALAAPISLLAMADSPRTQAPATMQALVPTQQQADTSAIVHGLLSDSRYAYRPRVLDASLGAEVWKRYLEALDPSKVYLTQQDIASVPDAPAKAVAAVKEGDYAPMYALFEIYRKRVVDRSQYTRDLLKQDIFDFSGHSTREAIADYIVKVSPKKTFLVHGDDVVCPGVVLHGDQGGLSFCISDFAL